MEFYPGFIALLNIVFGGASLPEGHEGQNYISLTKDISNIEQKIEDILKNLASTKQHLMTMEKEMDSLHLALTKNYKDLQTLKLKQGNQNSENYQNTLVGKDSSQLRSYLKEIENEDRTTKPALQSNKMYTTFQKNKKKRMAIVTPVSTQTNGVVAFHLIYPHEEGHSHQNCIPISNFANFTLRNTVFKSVVVDTFNSYNATNGIYTVPVSGIYHIMWGFSACAGSQLFPFFMVNNHVIERSLVGNIQSMEPVAGNNNYILHLNKGDELTTFFRQHKGSGYISTFSHNYFAGFMI